MKTIDEETQALKAVVREAHEAIQDLRALLKETQAMKEEVEKTAAHTFETLMLNEVREGLERYKQTIETAVEDATRRVDRRFDTIADILLGEDKESRRKGKPTLKQAAEKVAKERRERRD